MNGNEILIDTKAVIQYFEGNIQVKNLIDSHYASISFITEIETLSFHGISNEELILAQFLFDHIQIYQYNSLIRDNTIAIRRQHRLKLPDAIIAATAITLDIPLLTFDKAFTKVDGLQVVVPQV